MNKFEMTPVKGGSFMLGSKGKSAFANEKPQHLVTLSDFYIGKYPVTQAEWKAVMEGKNPSNFQGDNRPVETVSWDDAQAFVQALNLMTKNTRFEGHHYRLPTEAEWEYAARGGYYHTEGYKYAGSDHLKDVGWFSENSGRETKPVGLKHPNRLGIFDMSGNVWEWCADWYGDYPSGAQTNPTGPDKGLDRVVRGGCWYNVAQDCRAANRYGNTPDARVINLGFRLALSLQIK